MRDLHVVSLCDVSFSSMRMGYRSLEEKEVRDKLKLSIVACVVED